MAEDSGSFEVNGKRYSLPTALTLGEMADAERYFGVDFSSEDSATSIRMAAALIWIAVRRDEPSVSVEDIRDLDASVFESFLGSDANPPVVENDGSGEPSGEGSSATGGSRLVLPESIGSPGSDIGSDSALLTSSS